MLQRIHLVNFRRHVDTEIRFDNDQKLVVISGRNGSGKTSILEGIVYALYGETRSGRAGRRRSSLDRLVRRGAELEGMQVELDFTVGSTEYQVVRRRDNKVSSAILYGNGNPLVEGPDQVTAEIATILGMDSTGFRLAIIAEQNELDGLASLQPAKRAQMLARLLRLDAVTAAKDRARARYNTEREVLRSLGAGEDIAVLKESLSAEELARSSAEQALAATRASLQTIDTRIADAAAAETRYASAMEEVAKAEAGVVVATGEVSRIEAELSSLVVPDPPASPPADLADLAEETAANERSIAKAEAAAEIVSQREVLSSELQRVTERLGSIRTTLVRAEQEAESEERRAADHEVASSESSAADEEYALAAAEVAAAELAVREAERRVDECGSLGATCDRCGQPIDEAHRVRQGKQARRQLSTAKTALTAARKRVTAARSRKEAAAQSLRAAGTALAAAQAARIECQRLADEVMELERRESTYTSQLNRSVEEPASLDELYATRSHLAVRLALARQAAKDAQDRAEALERQRLLEKALEQARSRAHRAAAILELAQPSPEAIQAHEQYLSDLESRENESELAAFQVTELAVADERVTRAADLLRRAVEAAQVRKQHQDSAVQADNASRILAEAAAQLSTRIRPALEGAVTTLLTQLSDGRFTDVQITDDYDIKVLDDGVFVPVGELSGGEMDLVALAMRLALSEVTGDRHGEDALQLLVLDECFGSQDRDRRETIRQTLRNLRNLRGQIFIISHVEGLDDIADVEINVSVDEENGERVAAVALI